jgi:uncharacterized protein (TIGR03083 family)
MSRLEPATYQELFASDTARIAAIDPADLTNDVPHLEGWTVHSVVGHTGWLLRFIARNLDAPPDDAPPRSSVGEPPVGPDVLGWFAEGAEGLQAKLAAADLDQLHPSWLGPQPTSWWLRRVTNEVSIHRWDACSAAEGTAPADTEPIDTDLARDGIDEVLDVFAPNRLQFDVLQAAGETIHLHATDAPDGEWLVNLDADEIRWEHGHAKGDVAARGSMSDLLLLMWSRIPPDAVEVFGDAALLDRWQQAAKF